MKITAFWYHNDVSYATGSRTWWGTENGVTEISLYTDEDTQELPDGEYRVEIYIGNTPMQHANFTIGEKTTSTTKKTPSVKSDYDIAMEGTSTEIIPWTDVRYFNGEKKTVCGPVKEVKRADGQVDSHAPYLQISIEDLTVANDMVNIFINHNYAGFDGRNISEIYQNRTNKICATGKIQYYSIGSHIYVTKGENLEFFH